VAQTLNALAVTSLSLETDEFLVPICRVVNAFCSSTGADRQLAGGLAVRSAPLGTARALLEQYCCHVLVVHLPRIRVRLKLNASFAIGIVFAKFEPTATGKHRKEVNV
jgi:hypothetical protein